jgi:hypothetical protein
MKGHIVTMTMACELIQRGSFLKMLQMHSRSLPNWASVGKILIG